MPTPLPFHRQRQPSIDVDAVAGQGFTLVEVLVAVLAVAIGVTGLVTLTNITSSSQLALNTENRRADAIAADIAEVQRINDRYTCAGLTAASGGNCAVSANDVREDGYYPSNSNGQTNFRDRCDFAGSGADLVSGIATIIPTNSNASAALSASGVTRTIDTANQGQAHRYTVAYTAGGQTLATLTLVPTTAAWCP